MLDGFTLGGAVRGYIWGGLVRIFLVHHVTWSVNSICHFFGRRRFDIEDQSTNVAWLAVFSFGESWHHNHHAFPRSAYHGLRWWEIDLSGMFISMLARLGLAWNVVRITPERQLQKTAASNPRALVAAAADGAVAARLARGRPASIHPAGDQRRHGPRTGTRSGRSSARSWPPRETYAYDPDMDEAEGRRMWMFDPPGRTVVAIDSDGTVLGTANMYANRPGPGSHVASASFMVDPRHAGRGTGRALGEHVIEWARQSGFRAIQFNAVVETNAAAVALWRSLGFEVLTHRSRGVRSPRARVRRTAHHASIPVMREHVRPAPARGARSIEDAGRRRTKSPVCPPAKVESANPYPRSDPRRSAVPLTQAQLVSAVADRAELSKADAKRAVEALETIVLEQLGNAEKVRIGGIVQLTVRVKPASKKRTGRNPATGEEITIAAKPASVDVRARPLAKAKAALPSVQKARRRLAA